MNIKLPKMTISKDTKTGFYKLKKGNQITTFKTKNQAEAHKKMHLKYLASRAINKK